MILLLCTLENKSNLFSPDYCKKMNLLCCRGKEYLSVFHYCLQRISFSTFTFTDNLIGQEYFFLDNVFDGRATIK